MLVLLVEVDAARLARLARRLAATSPWERVQGEEARAVTPEALYLAAREAVSRRGLARLHLPKGALPPDALLDPTLHRHALAALQAARGGTPPPIRLTIWKGGASHAGTSQGDLPGEPWSGSLGDFAELLDRRAGVVAPKRRGWVVEPTDCPTGRRTNEATVALHALFLDCDGRGDWRDLLEALADLGLAHVAYRSGGHAPGTPKWRVVLPLSAPCPVTDDALRAAWRAAYLDARVVLGAAGRLAGEGFDPRTDAPSIPWFLTEHRRPEDPPREVLWRPGAALDLARLVHFLPPHEDRDVGDRATAPHAPLPDGQLDEVARALRAATSSVPSGRRDLYLALSGALLDRGISGDDVVELVEDISAAYPTSGDHPALHADNVRIARCTAAAHEAGRPVTRIGTLNDLFPDVARALDEVLPDALDAALRERFGAPPPPPGPPPAPPLSRAPTAPPIPLIPPAPGAADLRSVLSHVRRVVQRKRRGRRPVDKLDGDLVENFLAGEALVSPADAERSPTLGLLAGAEGLKRVGRALGNGLPTSVAWESVVLARPQVCRSPVDSATLAAGGATYAEAQSRRRGRVAERREGALKNHARGR